MKWGIPVPLKDTEEKYICWGKHSSDTYHQQHNGQKTGKPWEDYWNDTAIHFIGKDIIYHHALFWPALLSGYGCKCTRQHICREFLSMKVNEYK